MTYEIIETIEDEKYVTILVKATEGDWSGARKKKIDRGADIESEAKLLAEEIMRLEEETALKLAGKYVAPEREEP